MSETLIDCRYTAAVAAAASAAAASSSSSNGLTNNNKQDESSPPPGSYGLYSAIGEITDTFEDPHSSALVSADKGRTRKRTNSLPATVSVTTIDLSGLLLTSEDLEHFG